VGIINFLGSEQANWALDLMEDILPIMLAIFAVIGAVATGYAIYLGTMLAKAEDEGKRKQAKSRIVKTVVGIFIILVLASTLFNPLFFNEVFRGTTDRGEYANECKGST
jgi:H+/Cl- antiporter ClcA